MYSASEGVRLQSADRTTIIYAQMILAPPAHSMTTHNIVGTRRAAQTLPELDQWSITGRDVCVMAPQ